MYTFPKKFNKYLFNLNAFFEVFFNYSDFMQLQNMHKHTQQVVANLNIMIQEKEVKRKVHCRKW